MIKGLDEFVKPRTGEVTLLPDNERQIVANNFSSLVEDMMLAHARHVDTTNYVKFPNTSSLMLTYPLDDEHRLHIVIHSVQTAVNSIESTKRISIRETDNDNRSYRSHAYELKPDQPDVIRTDFYADDEKLSEPLDDDWDDDEFNEFYDNLDETPEQARERQEADHEDFMTSELVRAVLMNMQFDEQMGINHLPVDATEVAKLREVLSRADFIHL